MSWAVEEWKDGLPARALQKIQEIEGQLDKLKKERQQKQFQMDSLEATLQKQRQKMDSEKSEASAMKRENQSLVESCEHLEKTRQKLTHDIHTKEQQVNYLEGQLSTCKKQMDRLEQEVKKYKHELERSQTSHSSEIQLITTPQKTFAAPATPDRWQQDSKVSDLQEKYSREVEERKKLEAELKVMHVKLLNQSVVSHKDIARQQTGSSIFPWQQDQKHQPLSVLETPSRRRNGPSGVSWSFDDTPIKHPQQIASGVQSDTAGSQHMDQLKNINQDLRSKISELELHLQTQEKDLKSQVNKFTEIQSQLEAAKKDLGEKEKLLNKSRDELTKAASQYEQSVSKCSAVEMKLKQVTDEMNCQRHNSESMHRSLEQKIKDHERESQKELAQLQSSHQALDQQFNQMKNKMSMEIQQAKKDCNVLQSETDKMTTLKNRLEKELEELKQKHLRSEQALQASQAKEGELKRKFDETQREKNTLSCQLDQGMKRVKQLEDEKQNSEQILSKNRMMVDDLKAKTQTQSEELMELHKKLDRQGASSAQEMEMVKKTLIEGEAKNVKMQADLQKVIHEVELKSNQICALDKENEELKKTLNSLQKELAEMKKEYEVLQEWKTKKEELINNTEANRDEMLSKIAKLETEKEKLNDSQEELQKRINNVENEKICFSSQIDSLKGELLVKCVELEEKGKAFEELQQHLAEDQLKNNKDMDNLKKQMQEQVKNQEAKLLQEANKLEVMEQTHTQLLAEYESACILTKSKDSIIEMNNAQIVQLQESVNLQEEELEKSSQEKDVLAKECADFHEHTAELQRENFQMEISLNDAFEKIALLESDVKSLKDRIADIQGNYAELSKTNEDFVEKFKEVVNETQTLLQKNASLKELCNSLVAEAEEARRSLEQLNELHVQTLIDLEKEKTIAEGLVKDIAEERMKVADLDQKNTQFKDKNHKAEKMVKDLLENNESLEKRIDTVSQENENHLKEISMLRENLAEKDAMAEQIVLMQTELDVSNRSSVTLNETLENLQKQLGSSQELQLNLEKELQEKSKEIAFLETSFKQMQVKESEAEETKRSLELLQVQTATDLAAKNKITENLEKCIAEERKKAADLEQENTQLKEKKQEAEKMVKDLSEKNESIERHLDAASKENELHRKEMSMMTKALGEKDAMTEHILLIQAELEASNRSSATLKETLENIQKQLDSSAELQLNLEKELQERSGEKALLETSIKMFKETQIKESEDYVTERQSLLAKQNTLQGHISILEEQLQSKILEEQNVMEKLEMATHQMVKSKQDLEVSENKLKEVNNDLQKAVKELEDNKTKVHEEEMESLKTLLAKMKGQEEVQSCEIASLKEILHVVQSEHIKTSEALKEKNINMSKIKVQLEMLQMDLDDNETCINSFDAQVEELQGNVSSLEAKLSESETQKSTLQTKLDSVTEDFAKSSLEISQLSACLEETQKEQQSSSALAAELQTLQLSQELLKVSLEEENCKRANLEAMYSSLVELKQKLESNIKELKAESQTYQKEIDRLKQANDCLVAQIEEQQMHIEQLLSGTLAVKADITEEPTADEENQEFGEMPFANTSILPFEEDGAILDTSSPKLTFDSLDPLSSDPGKDNILILNKSSALEELSHTLESSVRTIEEQTSAKIEEVTLEHAKELQILQEQILHDKNELEAELKEEKKQTEFLSSQLETMQLQLQELELGCLKNKTQVNENVTQEKEKIYGELVSQKEILRKREDELFHLRSEFEVLESQMTIRKEMCSDLEAKVYEMETGLTNGAEKLASVNQENKKLNNHIEGLTEEIASLNLQLQTSKCQLSDVLEMMETLEITKGEWNEKFFQIESELKRVRSEKANLEKHILSMEADIEEMQEQKLKQETELETTRRTNCNLEQQLNETKAEGWRLKDELILCADERESENHSLIKWKEKAELLEKREMDTRELIKELEDDIRMGKRQNDLVSGQIDLLLKEKEELLQQSRNLENEVALLNEDKKRLLSEFNDIKNDSFASRESENLSSKINSLQEENVRLSQSLELSLLEKGEIASRLISTQEEVAQMRQGIEKLKVRIESDERKKNHMSQLLKDAQRKADVLQDNIEKLEREKELSEQTLEDAVLQAETAKAELEEIQTEMQHLSQKIKEMASELTDLKEEKSKLEQELLQKNNLVQELKLTNEEASEKLKSAEETTVNHQLMISDYRLKVGVVEEELQLCRTEVESKELKAQDLASRLISLEAKNKEFSHRVLENEKSHAKLCSSNQLLLKDIEDRQREFNEENAKLRSQISELHLIRAERDESNKSCMALQSTISQLEENTRVQYTEIEVLKTTTTSLESYTNQLEVQLAEMKTLNTEMTGKISSLLDSSVQLTTQHEKDLCLEREKQNFLETDRNLLKCQLQEAQTEIETYRVNFEALKANNEELQKRVSQTEENHDLQVKESYMRHEETLKDIQQQNEEKLNELQAEINEAGANSSQILSKLIICKSQKEEIDSALSELQNKLDNCEKEKKELNAKALHLSREKDSAVSKINLWMKSCKQLEKENQALQEELHKKENQKEALQTSKKQDKDSSTSDALQEELKELKEALELKSQEADDSMDRYCSLMVKVHKLEEANETLNNQLSLLSNQTRATKSQRSLRSDKSDLENNKAVEDSVVAGKRQRPTDDTPNKAQEALHSITKRLKAAAATPKASQDNKDYRPEGLPELVQRGFADIPIGEMSPFIIRRTTVQRCSPRLAARQALSSPPHAVLVSKQTAEGRTANTNNAVVLSPHSKSSEKAEQMTSRRSRNFRKSSEKLEQVSTSPKQNDNCQVQ